MRPMRLPKQKPMSHLPLFQKQPLRRPSPLLQMVIKNCLIQNPLKNLKFLIKFSLPGSKLITKIDNEGKTVPAGGCIKCEEDTYSLSDNALICQDCPNEHFKCHGGMEMELKPFLWRDSLYTIQVSECK